MLSDSPIDARGSQISLGLAQHSHGSSGSVAVEPNGIAVRIAHIDGREELRRTRTDGARGRSPRFPEVGAALTAAGAAPPFASLSPRAARWPPPRPWPPQWAPF